MPKPDFRHQMMIGAVLALMMLITRGQHLSAFGHSLPDASMAAFFLAGLYLSPVWAFAALFALGFAIDLVAINVGGVSGYCFTAAYWMLLPAYAALWGAGRWYADLHREQWSSLPWLVASVVVGGLLFELFSSGGFYLFSGRFADLGLVGLGMSVTKYLPQTFGALLLWLAPAVVVHLALVSLRGDAASRLATR